MNEKVKSEILGAFIAMSAKVGHVLDERWILQKLMPSLNPKERDEVNETIDEMKIEGLISTSQRSGLLVIALSQTGYDTIYPTDPVAAKAKIRAAVLKQFASSSSRAGHCIDERWIVHKLMPSLNPKEQDQVNSSLQEMEADAIIKIEKKNGMIVMVLTQKGFDTIY